MSIKIKVLAGAAAVALAAVPVAVAGTARAATPPCGGACINIFPKEYSGQSLGAPQDVLDVWRQAAHVGQPIILFRSSNTDLAEDFTYSLQGTVADFYAAHLVGSSVALRYGCHAGTGPYDFPSCSNSVNDQAYELQYSPDGVDSGLCVGVSFVAFAGEKVALEPCGVGGGTVWIQDTKDAPVGPYYAAINGSDVNFSHPFVLSYPVNGNPVNVPRPQLYVTNLSGFQGGTTNNDNQLWTGTPGVLP